MAVGLIVPEFDTFPQRSRDVHFGVGAIANGLRAAGLGVRVLDLNFVPSGERSARVKETARSCDPVGFTSYTCNHHLVEEYAKLIKQDCGDTVLVCGGPHITGLYLDRSPHFDSQLGICDALFVGESEETLANYCLASRGERAQSCIVGRPLSAEKLGAMPPIVRNGIDYSTLECARILASRGCRYRCAMCINSMAVSELRYRPLASVVDESIAISRVARSVFFVDDGLSVDPEYIYRLCSMLRERNAPFTWSCLMRADAITEELVVAMREAGCTRISIGCESGSEIILRSIGKGLDVGRIHHAIGVVKKHGIECRTSWIIGLPDETKSTVDETKKLLLAAKPDVAVIYQPIPYPGTRLAREGRDLIVESDHRHYFHGSGRPLMRSRHLDTNQIAQYVKDVSDAAYAVGLRVVSAFQPLDSKGDRDG